MVKLKVGNVVYSVIHNTLMPYLERDKYFDIIVDEVMEVCETIAKKSKNLTTTRTGLGSTERSK